MNLTYSGADIGFFQGGGGDYYMKVVTGERRRRDKFLGGPENFGILEFPGGGKIPKYRLSEMAFPAFWRTILQNGEGRTHHNSEHNVFQDIQCSIHR